MRRRTFTAGALALTAAPVAVRAQTSPVRTVGVLLTGDDLSTLGPFREALVALGYSEGRNINFEIRAGAGNNDRLAGLAADLVGRKVDIIVAQQTQAVLAARQATRDIPIVIGVAGDPVATGLIASLAHPGRNITGLTNQGPETGAKMLELVRDILPSARRIAVLANRDDVSAKPFVDQIRAVALTGGMSIEPIMARSGDPLDAAFAQMTAARVDGVIVQATLVLKDVIAMAMRHRIATFCNSVTFAREGGLLNYSANVAERGRLIAFYIDRIFKGAAPGDLPVQQPTRFDLVINMTTAKALGIEIPFLVLARADALIE